MKVCGIELVVVDSLLQYRIVAAVRGYFEFEKYLTKRCTVFDCVPELLFCVLE
jgi:hypothetical protein